MHRVAQQGQGQTSSDFLVIGSGAGGATLAWQLASGGAKTMLVEAGDWLRPSAPAPGEPGGIYMGDIHPDRSQPVAFVGGQTKFYGAALYRLRESDFGAQTYETGERDAWPISYETLAPHYDTAEALYHVHGHAAADATEPPRRTALPHGPLPHSPLVAEMVWRLNAAGAQTSPIPRSIQYRKAQGPCTLCAHCDAHLCRVEAKGDADMMALRPALASGNLVLKTRTKALRILLDAAGRRAIGVEVEEDGARHVLYAGHIIVACGLEHTLRLLRRSRCDTHPEGVGNQGGALGRYLAGHSTGMVFPFVTWGKLPAEHTKTFAINQFYHRGADWPYPLGVIQMSGQMPIWREAGRVMAPVARLVGDHALTAFYMSEALPTRQSGFHFQGDDLADKHEPDHAMQSFRKLREITVDLFRQAGYRVLARRRAPYLWHETGGARMSEDATGGVVDPHLAVHGMAGLSVCDASVLPSAGAVNTGLTIMALALRLGGHLLGQAALAANAQRPATGATPPARPRPLEPTPSPQRID